MSDWWTSLWGNVIAGVIVAVLVAAAGWIGQELGWRKAEQRFSKKFEAAPQVYGEELAILISKAARADGESTLATAKAIVSTRDDVQNTILRIERSSIPI